MPIVLLASLVLSKPMYLATSQLLLTPVRERVPSVAGEVAGLEQIARTSELLTGRILAEQVVKQIGPRELYKDLGGTPWHKLVWLPRDPPDPQAEFDGAVSRFLRSIVVEPAARSSIINVAIKHEDPAMAAKAVNLLNDLFIGRYLGVQKNPKAATFFEEQFASTKTKLRESEETLQAFKQRHGVATSIPDEIQRAENQLAAARASLNDTRKQQAEIASRLAEVRSQLRDTSTNARESNFTREKLAALELEEQELSIRMTPENPTLRTVREHIRMVRDRLAQTEALKSYGTSAPELHGALQGEMLRNLAAQKGLQVREQAEAAKAKEFDERLNGLRDANVEFGRLQQQLQLDEQSYRLYQNKFEELRISNAMDLENIGSVRVIEPAQAPVLPMPSKTRLILGLGTLFSLGGGIVLAFILQKLTGRLDTADDVERYLALPVLASIPHVSRTQATWRSV